MNHSEWAAPVFIIPKKDGRVRFVTDFRKLNAQIKLSPYPLPHIKDMLLKVSNFTYATALDLVMGYYNIRLSSTLVNYALLLHHSESMSTIDFQCA